MKKTVVVLLILSLVAALGYVTKYALEDESLRESRKKIVTYRIIAEEQRLIVEILESKIKIAKYQEAFLPSDANSP